MWYTIICMMLQPILNAHGCSEEQLLVGPPDQEMPQQQRYGSGVEPVRSIPGNYFHGWPLHAI